MAFLASPTPVERPILFSGPMVRALLDGSKTQTRRVVRGVDECPHGYDGVVTATVPQEAHLRGKHCFALASGESLYLRSPYGIASDRLWVRENGWQRPERTAKMMREGADTWEPYYFDADRLTPADHEQFKEWGFKRRPSIHMPRAACRLILEVTRVRVERLQDISEADARAEGITAPTCGSYRGGYSILWNSLNAKRGFSWAANPWVWVVQFRRSNAS